MSSHPSPSASPSRLSLTGFLTLLLIALMMGANHVAARTAFNHGVDVVTAVTFRSGITALVVALILWQQKVSLQLSGRQQKIVPTGAYFYVLVLNVGGSRKTVKGTIHLFVD